MARILTLYSMKKLTDEFFKAFSSALNVNLVKEFTELSEREWTSKNFTFATAVSVMSSSRIEGETLEVDSYVKHKVLDIEYLPNLTEKPNDLFKAYEFARDNQLTANNFLQAHSAATEHLLAVSQRGGVRKVNMLVMEQKTNRVQYEAANSFIVQREYESFWLELAEQELSIDEVFYYASLIHLVFVNIHPFNDRNGRTARQLEK